MVKLKDSWVSHVPYTFWCVDSSANHIDILIYADDTTSGSDFADM